MQKITDILNGIWRTIKRAYARLLAGLYIRCRETYGHMNGKNRLEITSRCQFIEDLCARCGVRIPDSTPLLPTSQEGLIRWYMAIRFNWTLRITIHKGKITIRYLDIPLKRLVPGKAKDMAETIVVWENQITPHVEDTKVIPGAVKEKPVTKGLQNKTPVYIQNIRRAVNIQQPAQLKAEVEQPKPVNVVQVNGALIDNSF